MGAMGIRSNVSICLKHGGDEKKRKLCASQKCAFKKGSLTSEGAMGRRLQRWMPPWACWWLQKWTKSTRSRAST
eukprot:1159765-Pelagomonas_calceolata.AAC.26